MEHFKVSELVPKILYDKYGELSLRYMDSRIIACLLYIRKTIGKRINVNNAQFDSRTLRTQASRSYSTWSDHSFGRAIDFDVEGINSDDVRKFIIKDIVNSTELKKLGLTGVEDGTQGWIHITCSNLDGWGFDKINGICLIPMK